MIWAGIIGNELVGPFKVEDDVKIDLAGYTQFLEKNLTPWMKKKSAAFNKKIVFMQANGSFITQGVSWNPHNASKLIDRMMKRIMATDWHLIQDSI